MRLHDLFGTSQGVRFVKSLYGKAASEARVRRLSLDGIRGIFGAAGQCPLNKELFLGNTRCKGELSEAEWVMRWHLAFALEPVEATAALERLMLDHGQIGEAIDTTHNHPNTSKSLMRIR